MTRERPRSAGGARGSRIIFLLVQKEYFFLSPLYTLSKKREEHVTCHNYPPVTVGKVGCSDCVMWHVRGRDPQGGMGLENYFSYCSKRMIFFSPLPSLSKERERHNTSHNRQTFRRPTNMHPTYQHEPTHQHASHLPTTGASTATGADRRQGLWPIRTTLDLPAK